MHIIINSESWDISCVSLTDNTSCFILYGLLTWKHVQLLWWFSYKIKHSHPSCFSCTGLSCTKTNKTEHLSARPRAFSICWSWVRHSRRTGWEKSKIWVVWYTLNIQREENKGKKAVWKESGSQWRSATPVKFIWTAVPVATSGTAEARGLLGLSAVPL